MVYQALYQIGQRGILYYDFEMDLDEEEKQLEEAQKIIPERLLFFALVENLESAEQAALFHKLKEHHPSLENAKVVYIVDVHGLAPCVQLNFLHRSWRQCSCSCSLSWSSRRFAAW